MAKKKQRISTIELFIWKFVGFLFLATWVIAIITTVTLVSQYGWYDAGFTYFYLFLALVPLSYTVLYASIARLRPRGFMYGASMFVLLLGILPFAFFASFFIRTGFDPILILILVSGAIASAVYLLHRKTAL